MALSPRALAMRDDVGRLVRQARELLSPERALEPAQIERTFTIRCHDALLAGIGPEMIRRLERQAPAVTLRFLAETDEEDDWKPGRVDLYIGAVGTQSPRMHHEEIAADHLVVALPADHPAAQRTLTMQRYAAARHVVVSRRGRLRDPMDDALEAAGLRRRVVAVAPTSGVALQLARACHLLVAVAARACGPAVSELGLVTRPLPVHAAPLPVVQSWHEYLDGDRAHAWLRALSRSVISELMQG
jgi:DNA-binding transcriptional LysR family regulator